MQVIYKYKYLILSLLFGLLFSLSCIISIIYPIQSSSSSIISQLMGSSRVAFSQHFFETADVYFHRGVEHQHKKLLQNNPYFKIKEIVSPTKHVHVHGSSIKEIMPWLWLSIKTNPHNMETYLVASFWMANSQNRPDVALSILEQAQKNNPYNYQVPLEKGKIYLKQGLLQKAKSEFDTSIVFFKKTVKKPNKEQENELAEVLLYRGLIAESENDINLAISCFKKIITLFPKRTAIANRIQLLQNGKTPDTTANIYWKSILQKNIKEKAECHHHDDHDDDHEHEHEH